MIEDGFDPSSLSENPSVQAIKDFNERQQKNFKALTFLYSAIDDSIFPRVVGIKTVKAAWSKLQEEFQGSERVRQQRLSTLKREFELLKMKDSETVREYSAKLMEIVNQMKLYGEQVTDYKVVEKILISLPDRFEAKISAIEESCNLKELSITELCTKLQAQELRFTRKSKEVTEGAFQMKQKGKQPGGFKDGKKKFQDKGGGKGKSVENSSAGDQSKKEQVKFPPCPHCNRTNHPERYCWQKYGKPQCRFCKKFGHIEKNCKVKQNQGNSGSSASYEANYSGDKQTAQDHLFMAIGSSRTLDDGIWLIDSGCTSHMAKDASLFSSLDRSIRTKVTMGNGNVVQVEGRGSVAISTKQGLIAAVLLFLLLADDSRLWHSRYGHYNLRSLKFACDHNLIRDLIVSGVTDEVAQDLFSSKFFLESY
ncbi:uncharacterized protein LOC119986908 [Tripterygium wilfordii]|uniref:uncharacterized protein LOC119986908 n=1 Tax=Tripterygium wilfordii TaxID=458696 RepID=UPI0018F84BDE|nr:uncharacterized protein LOC119986908 [Tripterygium wilfordii]